eukprot:6198551-Pleurochrysis_carterae.AAC.3
MKCREDGGTGYSLSVVLIAKYRAFEADEHCRRSSSCSGAAGDLSARLPRWRDGSLLRSARSRLTEFQQVLKHPDPQDILSLPGSRAVAAFRRRSCSGSDAALAAVTDQAAGKLAENT